MSAAQLFTDCYIALSVFVCSPQVGVFLHRVAARSRGALPASPGLTPPLQLRYCHYWHALGGRLHQLPSAVRPGLCAALGIRLRICVTLHPCFWSPPSTLQRPCLLQRSASLITTSAGVSRPLVSRTMQHNAAARLSHIVHARVKRMCQLLMHISLYKRRRLWPRNPPNSAIAQGIGESRCYIYNSCVVLC